MKAGKLITDDVPFSCCSPFSSRPCIHHGVDNEERHVKLENTLSKTGCTEVLVEYFDNALLLPGGYAILVSFFAQVNIQKKCNSVYREREYRQ